MNKSIFESFEVVNKNQSTYSVYSLVDDDDEATKDLYAEFADDTKNMKKSVDSVSVENRKLKVKLIYVHHGTFVVGSGWNRKHYTIFQLQINVNCKFFICCGSSK